MQVYKYVNMISLNTYRLLLIIEGIFKLNDECFERKFEQKYSEKKKRKLY